MTKLWADKLRQVDPYVPGEQSKNKNIIKYKHISRTITNRLKTIDKNTNEQKK